MNAVSDSGSGLAVMDLREFFHDSVQQALQHQQVEVEAQTEHYLVNVLTSFAHADAFYEQTAGGAQLKPLACMLADALEAADATRQRQALQRMGDVSLFMAGFFAHGFARKLVDLDYHIAMGGRAYAALADSWRGKVRGAVFAAIFTELAGKFQRLVDVLNEVADMARPASNQDVLRLYEVWLATGSPRARQLLASLGVMPVAGRTHA
ncbi:MAG: hypothetical protein QM800_06885 [Paludibacter sp.]